MSLPIPIELAARVSSAPVSGPQGSGNGAGKGDFESALSAELAEDRVEDRGAEEQANASEEDRRETTDQDPRASSSESSAEPDENSRETAPAPRGVPELHRPVPEVQPTEPAGGAKDLAPEPVPPSEYAASQPLPPAEALDADSRGQAAAIPPLLETPRQSPTREVVGEGEGKEESARSANVTPIVQAASEAVLANAKSQREPPSQPEVQPQFHRPQQEQQLSVPQAEVAVQESRFAAAERPPALAGGEAERSTAPVAAVDPATVERAPASATATALDAAASSGHADRAGGEASRDRDDSNSDRDPRRQADGSGRQSAEATPRSASEAAASGIGAQASEASAPAPKGAPEVAVAPELVGAERPPPESGTPRVAPQTAPELAGGRVFVPAPIESIPIHSEWLAARGGGSVTLQLHPPELGAMEIRVTVVDGVVSVVMAAERSVAVDLAREYRDSLSLGMSSRDLRLDQFEVRLAVNPDAARPDRDSAGTDASSRGRDGRSEERARRGRAAPVDELPRALQLASQNHVAQESVDLRV